MIILRVFLKLGTCLIGGGLVAWIVVGGIVSLFFSTKVMFKNDFIAEHEYWHNLPFTAFEGRIADYFPEFTDGECSTCTSDIIEELPDTSEIEKNPSDTIDFDDAFGDLFPEPEQKTSGSAVESPEDRSDFDKMFDDIYGTDKTRKPIIPATSAVGTPEDRSDFDKMFDDIYDENEPNPRVRVKYQPDWATEAQSFAVCVGLLCGIAWAIENDKARWRFFWWTCGSAFLGWVVHLATGNASVCWSLILLGLFVGVVSALASVGAYGKK